MKNLIHYSFQSSGVLNIVHEQTIRFIGRTDRLSLVSLQAEGTCPVQFEDYLVFSYRAKGIFRSKELTEGVLSGVSEDKIEKLIYMKDITTNGDLHRVIVKTEGKKFEKLRFSVKSRSPIMSFEIVEMYTCALHELPKRYVETSYVSDGYACIDMGVHYNGMASGDIKAIDGGIDFPVGTVGLQHIPFIFSQKAHLVRPPEGPDAVNDEIIENFTAQTKRKLCRPESRESRITVEVKAKAKEAYFVLYQDGFAYERCAFCAPDPTILGSAEGEVLKPLVVNDVERFAVIVHYADGTEDECFPTNLSTKRHEITGEFGVYGVTLHNKTVSAISFETRMLDTDISLMALTLNQAATTVLGEMFPKRRKHVSCAFRKKPAFSTNGDILTIQNGAFVLELNTLDGLSVVKAVSAYSPSFSMSGPLLMLRDKGNLVRDFKRIRTELNAKDAKVVYQYQDYVLKVMFTLAEKDTISMMHEITYLGDDERSVGVLFPILSNVAYNSYDDLWYFLPKYQNTESNGSCYVYEESAPSYPHQFMDLFSMEDGAGLSLNTRERDVKVRKYSLTKNEEKTEAFVEYPDMYCKLSCHAVQKGSLTHLCVHKGDWHASYKSYKEWIDTWYEPYHCQDKLWYRQLFWLIAEIEDFIEDSSVTHFPVWYDEATKTYRFEQILQQISEIYGATPDILHLWAWTWDDDRKHMLWGNFGDSDFEKIGGLDNFKNALLSAREKFGSEISLYVHPTLLSDAYPHFKKYAPHYMVKTADGAPVGFTSHNLRMCHAERGWREYVLDMYKNIYEKMGTKIFYVDEFSLRVDNRCYNADHQHDTPSNLLKTDRDFIIALKDETPKDIALYGEYYPVDINAKYIDCNISYYILDSINEMIEQGTHDHDGSDKYGRVFTDIYRFVFPKVVQLILPMAMRKLSWQPLKATFFNGEAIYDSFWDCEERRGREFMAKSYRIKKKYADCFSSDVPETMIESECDAICVNKFPGNGRTVYTIFNRGYHTYAGTVLKIAHADGADYYDVWNDKPCVYTVMNGYAYIKSEVKAQNIGAIVQIIP